MDFQQGKTLWKAKEGEKYEMESSNIFQGEVERILFLKQNLANFPIGGEFEFCWWWKNDDQMWVEYGALQAASMEEAYQKKLNAGEKSVEKSNFFFFFYHFYHRQFTLDGKTVIDFDKWIQWKFENPNKTNLVVRKGPALVKKQPILEP
jgi:hypothetical protein